MALSSETQMNLAALQRADPYITSIIDTASQVALYKFNSESGEWEKTGIEGAMFVYKRVAPPLNGFFVMNRLSRNNMIEPITKGLEFQKQNPFLLYRNSKLSILGIWFYETDDCEKIGALMNRLVEELNGGVKRSSSPKSRQRCSSEGNYLRDQNNGEGGEGDIPPVDILSMLSRAQNEFDMSQHRSHSSGAGNSRPDEPLVLHDDPPAPCRLSDVIKPRAMRAASLSTTPDVLGPTVHATTTTMRQLSVADLFASASGAKVAGGTVSEPSLVRSVSVDERSSGLTDEPPIEPDINTRNVQSGKGLHLLHRLLSFQEQTEKISESRSGEGDRSLGVEEKGKLSTRSGKKEGEGKSPIATGLQMKQDKESGVPVLLPAMLESSPSPSPTTVQGLYLPGAPLFTSPALKENIVADKDMIFGSSKPSGRPPLVLPSMFSDTPQGGSAVATTTPSAHRTPSMASPRDPPHDIDPLTKAQLQKAMLHLIKNDDDFLSTLYNAYIQTLHDFTTKKS